MRKIMMTFCAMSMFAFMACSSDDDSPSAPVVAPGTSGTIASITVNNSLYEVWNWDDEHLTSVTNGANGQEKVRFSYDGNGRVKNVVFSSLVLAGIPLNSTTLKVHYNGDEIGMLRMVRSDNSDIFVADVNYDGDKISGATLDIDNSMVFTLFNTILPMILGRNMDLSDTLIRIDRIDGNIDFDWTGNNVSSLLLEIDVDAKSTAGQLAELVGDLSIFGDNASEIESIIAADPTRVVNLSVTINDTANYTYDSHKNPYQGYMGQLDVSTLSAQNALTEKISRWVNLQVSTKYVGITIPLLNKTYPLTSSSKTYSYQLYNEGGYPVKVSMNNGEAREYRYKE